MAFNWSGLAGGLLSGAIGAITGGMSARKQYQYQSKLMDKQNSFALQMYDMDNAYNTPVMQRARLEAANLNPDLMYGSGGVSNVSGGAPSSASGQAPHVDYGKPDLMSNVMQYALVNAQADKLNQESQLLAERAESEATSRELMKANARLAASRSLGQDIDNRFAADRRWLENESLEYNNTLKKMDVQSYQYRLDLEARRVANDNMRVKNQVLQLGLNEKKLSADLSKIRAEVSEIMSRIPVNNAQRRKIIADAFETELLNEYYYSNGRVPGANQVTNLFNELRAKSQDLIGVVLGRKSWDSLIR
uniref:DNA pilot protein n=1 Tax=Dulem virus 132 TaxID=3145609 RepID=A0AAU8B0M3_9VIRU